VIAAPAVDLRGGRCVQLVGGNPDAEAVSLDDPVSAAATWVDLGFETLHFVDLDAALGTGDNLDTIRQLLAECPTIDTQVGGGIRDDERARVLIEAGADRIIVGTRALDDREWFRALAERYPGQVMVALDTERGRILRKGWQSTTELSLADYLAGVGDIPLAGILSTDVGREGRMEGIDRDETRRTVDIAGDHPMWISGGVTTTEELQYLDDIGAAGAVLGMALYTKKLNPNEVARGWGRSQNEKAGQ
jgi:phosphoribosylformimino-5-aminoimidazole carboxamide ribotide isomerase